MNCFPSLTVHRLSLRGHPWVTESCPTWHLIIFVECLIKWDKRWNDGHGLSIGVYPAFDGASLIATRYGPAGGRFQLHILTRIIQIGWPIAWQEQQTDGCSNAFAVEHRQCQPRQISSLDMAVFRRLLREASGIKRRYSKCLPVYTVFSMYFFGSPHSALWAFVFGVALKSQCALTTYSSRTSEHSLSSKGVTVNSPELVLSPQHVIANSPQLRSYEWAVTNTTASFDGYTRNVLIINNQFPGPLIEVNEGDTIRVKVTNHLNTPLSIHWHGIFQRGSQWMDGPEGITQCPLQPGVSFEYQFQVRGQFGTFWYHVRHLEIYLARMSPMALSNNLSSYNYNFFIKAHSGNLLSDGIQGPLIVHSQRDPLVRGRDFDQDMILQINDWFHDPSTYVIQKLLSAEGYNGSIAAPSPNSALINGIGFFNCQKYANGQSCKTNQKPLEITVEPNQRTRLRIIQGGSHAMFRVSIDNHPLQIIEADSTPVKLSQAVHRVPIHNGERYSVLLDTQNDKPGDSFYLRAAMDTDCFAWLAPGMDTSEGNTALAIVRVKSSISVEAGFKPSTRDWSDILGGSCIDLNSSLLTPRIDPQLGNNVLGKIFFNVSFGSLIDPQAKAPKNILGRFFVNSITASIHPQKPLLHQFLDGGQGFSNNSDIASLIIDKPGVWDVIINNLDQALDHPIHLHGMDTCMVSLAKGFLNESNATKISYDDRRPLCRDVHVIPGGSFIVLRIMASNPGIWFFHCHIGFHLASGFAGVVIIQPDFLKTISLPSANQKLCVTRSSTNQGAKRKRKTNY
ncbi:hypothetical protein O181_014768 [Austropuccinia psidii MF-1]|uniref:Uncharacterized protein n=1 Tax=Austropuccinia psidii MF-1 TaxID=1389203 RepID=A0A9Q3C168_9BASI|nr:hypothetical protein [Austropuccinia psidii MF-1]